MPMSNAPAPSAMGSEPVRADEEGSALDVPDLFRPLDAFRLLRHPKCTATAMQRWGMVMIILRADNATRRAKFSMGTLAADMNVTRRCVVKLLTDLETGGDGMPIGIVREVGQKLEGHRRDANTYTHFVKPGWALEAYENRESGSLGNVVPQSKTNIGEPGSPTMVNQDHQVGDLRSQVLPSSLPKDLPREERSPAGSRPPVESKSNDQPTLVPVDPPRDDAREVWEHHVRCWRRKNPKATRPPELTDKRRKLAKARLGRFRPDELKRALDGMWASDFHVDNGHTRFELIMRDDEHVEMFLEKAPKVKPSPREFDQEQYRRASGPPVPPPPRPSHDEQVAINLAHTERTAALFAGIGNGPTPARRLP